MTATQTARKLTFGSEQTAGPRGQFRFCEVRVPDPGPVGHVEFSPSREFGNAYFATDLATCIVAGQPATGFATARKAAEWLAEHVAN